MARRSIDYPMSVKLLLVFALAEFLLSLTPGPAVFLVVSQGMKFGFKPSLRGILGILTGNTTYFALSAFGLGTLLLASVTLFQIIKWLGVAYLIFIGLRMVLSRNESKEKDERLITSRRSLRLFSQGLITQLSNPRAVVFFTALLPQFISPGRGMFQQFIVLGLVSIMVESPVLVSYGWLAERGGALIPQRFSTLPDRIAGGFLIGAGLGLAAMRRT
jgi:homoserine/homoserine lactone efflux protein